MTAQQELQNILNQAEYTAYYSQKQSFWEQWLERFINWLNQLLEPLFPHVEISPRASEWLAYAIIAVCFVLIALLLFLLLSRFVRRKRLRQRAAASVHDLEMSLAWYLNEAARYERQEDYAYALRHLFLGFILFLDEKGLLEARAWKTNGEYYQDLQKAHKELAADFYAAALKFEETMYGGRSISPQQFQDYRKLIQSWLQRGEKYGRPVLLQES